MLNSQTKRDVLILICSSFIYPFSLGCKNLHFFIVHSNNTRNCSHAFAVNRLDPSSQSSNLQTPDLLISLTTSLERTLLIHFDFLALGVKLHHSRLVWFKHTLVLPATASLDHHKIGDHALAIVTPQGYVFEHF